MRKSVVNVPGNSNPMKGIRSPLEQAESCLVRRLLSALKQLLEHRLARLASEGVSSPCPMEYRVELHAILE
jgi:hypothetical protein